MLRRWIDTLLARRHPFKSREEIKAEVEAHRDAIGHEAAQRFSRGNVDIKLGEFTTREDLDHQKRLRSAS